ncbi:MAG: aldehyde dehydrogenase family protein [Polyangiaceae bacterium]|jgi:aldehyde dehydrogenase (NAD+)
MQQQPVTTDAERRANGQTVRAIPGLVSDLRAAFETGRTRSIDWRVRQLDGIRRLVVENEKEIVAALHDDVGKPEPEAFMAEVHYTLSELALIKKKLPSWAKPERVPTPMFALPGKSRIVREPLGVVLIIGPWNYPFQLIMGPLVGAIAAGNCAVVKPSEIAPATSALIARLLPRYVDAGAVCVVEGGVAETTALLAERFDHIFYTGNGAVGRIVMEAAAKHLTPVTLELGGKSPCIIDKSADLDVTVKRIAWGKFYNAGQTCVAPDYLLVHEAVHDAVLARLKETIRDFYGNDPQRSHDFARIVNERHHRRLMKLMKSGEIVVGGENDESERYIAPTVLRDVSPDSPVMAEEIFGPILPVLRVGGTEEAISFINARPKPLALYVFAADEDVQTRVIDRTSSGGATINHAWLHLAVPGLPFGGVGESGMGAYHGRTTYETFSHRKAVLHKPTAMDPPLMYPPYTAAKSKWVKRLL